MLLAQLVLQALAVQTYGLQLTLPLSTQVPLPLQVSAAVSVVLPEQLGATHCVPAAWSAQAPLPLQAPLVPQVEAACAAHSLCGSCPFGTLAQVPLAAPVSALEHAWQRPVQDELQQ